MVSWFDGWVGLLVDCFVGRFVVSLIVCSYVLLVRQFVGWFVRWFVGWVDVLTTFEFRLKCNMISHDMEVQKNEMSNVTKYIKRNELCKTIQTVENYCTYISGALLFFRREQRLLTITAGGFCFHSLHC